MEPMLDGMFPNFIYTSTQTDSTAYTETHTHCTVTQFEGVSRAWLDCTYNRWEYIHTR